MINDRIAFFDSFSLLYSKRLVSLEALERMRQVFEEEGVTLDDLLEGLDEVRQEMSMRGMATGGRGVNGHSAIIGGAELAGHGFVAGNCVDWTADGPNWVHIAMQ